MNTCWARSIGGCSSKISGEHVVSQSIFQDDLLQISGVSWLSKPRLALPKKNLTANVLCTTHNSNLSNLDSEVQKLSTSIRNCFSNPELNISVEINGWFFERWCLKMLLGLLASGWTEGGKIYPPQEFVEIAFGTKTFQDGAGIYFLKSSDGYSAKTDIVRWNFLLDSVTNTGVCGIAITLDGIITLLITRRGNPEPLIQSLGKTSIYDFTNANLSYRPEGLSYTISETKSQLNISFSW